MHGELQLLMTRFLRQLTWMCVRDIYLGVNMWPPPCFVDVIITLSYSYRRDFWWFRPSGMLKKMRVATARFLRVSPLQNWTEHVVAQADERLREKNCLLSYHNLMIASFFHNSSRLMLIKTYLSLGNWLCSLFVSVWRLDLYFRELSFSWNYIFGYFPFCWFGHFLFLGQST